jgi:hypothetical protein
MNKKPMHRNAPRRPMGTKHDARAALAAAGRNRHLYLTISAGHRGLKVNVTEPSSRLAGSFVRISHVD